ncbi:MAG: mercury transporter MerT [Notoacmeibacter sp.]|nr:mercury transporter MerT [Notoacmeibacter sp.]
MGIVGKRPETADVDRAGGDRTAGLFAVGGLLGAVAASSCCILPLGLFSLGITGAWLGRLSALAPYQPLFVTLAVGFLGTGFWLSRRAPACPGGTCARTIPSPLVRTALWSATALVLLALAWPYILPLVLT